MLKKIIAGFVAVIMSVSALATVSFAQSAYDLTIVDGKTVADSSTGRQYFVIKSEGLANKYTSSVQVSIKVTSNKISDAKVKKGVGLYRIEDEEEEYLAASAYTVKLDTASDGTQYINVSFASTTPATTKDGRLFEIYVVPEDTTKDVQLKLYTDNSERFCLVNDCKADDGGDYTSYFTSDEAMQIEYKLAAGTSTISKVDAEITPVIKPGDDKETFKGYVTATVFDNVNGTEEYAEEVATGFRVELPIDKVTDNIVWKVSDGTTTKYHKMDISTIGTLTGQGNAMFGLAVKNLSTGTASAAYLGE